MAVGRPNLDLIVATVGRIDELGRLFASLEDQTYRGFRVLVVDQNVDDRIEVILSRHEGSFPIVRLTSAPGLNRARNVAICHLTGNLVALTDDDCRYPPDLLERVVGIFESHPEWGGVTARSVDFRGRPSNMRWDTEAGPIDRFNLWRRAISYCIFLRRSVIETVGDFNEQLGPGAGTPWGSGDEADYLLRALEAGLALRYEPSLQVEHESPRPPFTRAAYARAFAYGKGNGRVLREHRYPFWFVAYRVAQLGAGALFFFVTGRIAMARFYGAMAAGRVSGWLGFRRGSARPPRGRAPRTR